MTADQPSLDQPTPGLSTPGLPTPLTFVEPPVLSRAVFDRADEIRDDAERLAAGWPDAVVLPIDARGRYPVTDAGALRWSAARDLGGEPPADAVFLGIVGGVDRWTVRVDEIDGATDDPRHGAVALGPDEGGLLVTALGILNWHHGARFSPIDGAPTEPAHGGWVRRNTATGRDEFPRTDAAIITVVHDGADHVLLGRQNGWPAGWYSTLAGFVEPGESLEQCVVREIHEEVGITVTAPRYLGSQPWPFPRSLMLGFEAIADRSAPLDYLDGEIAHARWFHRDEVREALADDRFWSRDQAAAAAATVDPAAADGPDRLLLPGSISISRALIVAWAERV